MPRGQIYIRICELMFHLQSEKDRLPFISPFGFTITPALSGKAQKSKNDE